jgi:PIN domain nuclease of toxin-antitoxin system
MDVTTRNLLDTHTFIWFVEADQRLTSLARKEIETIDATNFVSIASIWEIAIKISRGRLELKTPFSKINEQLEVNFFEILPVSFKDTLLVSSLRSIMMIHLTGLSLRRL